ncbi:GNAT family N-acetyltransferase [Corallococcus exercitus]|uniref:GNAT family N-acetyltransferase n=1 Tax=Corallococcus exercitus TaxID=2316736 RepID=A0A7Y4JWX8_9BACT|nr:GNAT family N-acetyltransferase [Corallococcus exercitus]NOK12696.1 GNAT family N-acetyltransferase [Corallococcus exercitus]
MAPVRLIERTPPSTEGSESAQLASKLVGHYVERGTTPFIGNTRHRVLLADVDGEVTPLIVNDGADSDCYLTSPFINYITYAEEFVNSVKEPGTRRALLAFIRAVRTVIRPRHLDRVVYVNHWMVATGPALCFTPEQLERLTQALRERFPKHAFVFKRATAETAAAVARERPGAALHAIFNRQMYVWRHEEGKKPPREFRQDRNLLNQHRANLRRLTAADPGVIDRLRELYRALYIDKYSDHNAFFTEAWFEEVFRQGLLEVYGIEVEGRLAYFVTCFVAGGELIGSVVGHDPVLSRKHGLYRAGMSHLMQLAEQRDLPLNLSSGSGQFKQKRGATPLTEYELLCFSHLPWRARLSWSLLRRIYNAVGPRVFSALSI